MLKATNQNKKKMTAKLFLESADLQDHVTVRAYGNLLKEIMNGSKETTYIALMDAPAFNAQYNEYHVFTSITRS